MLLDTRLKTDFLEIVYTAPTVVEPGEKIIAYIKILALQTLRLHLLKWELPGTVTHEVEGSVIILPEILEADRAFETKAIFLTKPGQEGFGEMSASLHLTGPEGEKKTVTWSAWISVFKREFASDPAGLSDRHRDRLVEFINARPRNGQIAISDIFSCCSDFLNIEISDSIKEMVIEEDGLFEEGIPVDPWTYREFILGEKEYAFIQEIEAEPEEQCPESDDRLDVPDVREIKLEVDDSG
jgi:hypothetical protein